MSSVFGWPLNRGRRGQTGRALLTLTLLLLTLPPAASRLGRKTPVWLSPCRAHDVTYYSPYSPAPADKYSLVQQQGRHLGGGRRSKEEVEMVGRNNRPSPKTLRRLRLQITVTYAHFKDIIGFLPKDLCNNEVLKSKADLELPDIALRKLPENPTKWYKKKVKCLDKKNKVKQILPKLHEGLQPYLAYVEKLRDPHWSKWVLDCRYQREKRLEEISGKLAQLLCEVDKCMKDMGIAKKGPGLGARDGKVLLQNPDSKTLADLQEAAILSSYGTFLKDWYRIVRQVVGKKGSHNCTSSHNQSVAS